MDDEKDSGDEVVALVPRICPASEGSVCSMFALSRSCRLVKEAARDSRNS